MALWSNQLAYFQAGQPFSSTHVFTVPAGKLAVIKEINIVSSGPTAASVTLSVKKGAADQATLQGNTPTGGGQIQFPGRFMVLAAGDELRCAAGGTGFLTMLVSGYLLTP